MGKRRGRFVHSDEGEDGFTMIELMVVVLILGILISIMIPLFLGQRTRAEDRAAQSVLRDGIVAAKTYFADKDSYTGFTPGVGGTAYAMEPSTTWVGTVAALAGSSTHNTVAIVQASGQSALLVSLSETGTYFGLGDQANSSGTTMCSSTTPPGWTLATGCVGGW